MEANPDKNQEYQNNPLKSIISDTIFLIESAENPKFLLGSLEDEDAFPIPETGISLVVADAGKGKSILVRGLVERLKDNPNLGFVYADYEFDPSIAKQREWHKLADLEDRFILIIPQNEEKFEKFFFKEKSYKQYLSNENLEEFEKLLALLYRDRRLTYRQKVFFAVAFFQSFRFENVLVIVDSLEDLVENTSDDTEAKKITRLADNYRKNIAFLINHHVKKHSRDAIVKFSFRGSQIWRTKAKVMLYINDTTKEDDYTLAYEIWITKIRVAYLTGVDKVYVRVNTENWTLDYHFNADKEAVYILKHAFWILKNKGSLSKTEFREELKKRTRKGTQKVEEVLKDYEHFFQVKRNGRTKIYSLPEGEKLLELKRFIGLEDKEYEESVRRVASLVEKMPPDYEKEITLSNGVTMKITREGLERNLFRYSKERLDEIYSAIAPDFFEPDISFYEQLPDETTNLELDLDISEIEGIEESLNGKVENTKPPEPDDDDDLLDLL